MQSQQITGESSLAAEVAEILRNRILNGEYEMGEKLVENKIANELKGSRTPVRDAFKQLVKERLIEYIPNKGCFAKGFSQKDMADIYAVRKAIEDINYYGTWKSYCEDEYIDTLRAAGKGLSDANPELFAKISGYIVTICDSLKEYQLSYPLEFKFDF